MRKYGASIDVKNLMAWLLIMGLLIGMFQGLDAVIAEENLAETGNGSQIYRSATELDYPPFSVIIDGKADGFSVELLKAVAAETGIQIQFKVDEWAILKEELKKGQLDVLPLVSYSEERDQYYDFSVPYIVMYGNIFVQTGNKSIEKEQDLNGKKIAVMNGDTAHEYAIKQGLSDELILTSTFQEAFQMLTDGDCDAVLAQSLVGEKIISDLGIGNVKAVNQLADDGITRIKIKLNGFEQKFCFAVKEGDKELLSKLNEGLAVVSTNGTYGQLYKKWFPFLVENKTSIVDVIKYLALILVPLLMVVMFLFVVIVRQQVRRKTRELKSANEAKSRFLANMSHELRTPLNAILGYSAMMQKDKGLTSQGLENLQIINRSGKHLLALINDILEITRIETQKITLKVSAFNLQGMIRDIKAMFALECAYKGLEFQIRGIKNLPEIVEGDVLKLRSVLINLLGNAIKFTKKGSISLSFQGKQESNGRYTISIEVMDTGIGISQAEIGNLFQQFSQTESGRDTSTGTGLGLSISQEYVKLMGGEIFVDSTPNQGSTFSFNIVVNLAEGEIQPEDERFVGDAKLVLPENMERPVMLVAEDTKESRDLLVGLLSRLGCQVVEAENGAEAVKLAIQYEPAIIWMDIRMPIMDGFEAAREIRRLRLSTKPVIIAVSAHVFKEEKEAILQAGCDAVLAKPFSESELYGFVEKYLNTHLIIDLKEMVSVREALLALSETQRGSLQDAVLRLDQNRMMDIINLFRKENPDMGKVLEKEISQLRFTNILRAIKEISEPTKHT